MNVDVDGKVYAKEGMYVADHIPAGDCKEHRGTTNLHVHVRGALDFPLNLILKRT